MHRWVFIVLVVSWCCHVGGEYGAAVSEMDNQNMPQGHRIAIFLTGLFKPKVTDLVALP